MLQQQNDPGPTIFGKNCATLCYRNLKPQETKSLTPFELFSERSKMPIFRRTRLSIPGREFTKFSMVKNVVKELDARYNMHTGVRYNHIIRVNKLSG